LLGAFVEHGLAAAKKLAASRLFNDYDIAAFLAPEFFALMFNFHVSLLLGMMINNIISVKFLNPNSPLVFMRK
jgi:hypothetical protein